MSKEVQPRIEIDGREVESTDVETIEFVYNGKIIKMQGTRVIVYADGETVRYPIHYDSLVATLAHVPQQFGPPEDDA